MRSDAKSYEDENVSFAWCGPVGIAVWRGATEAEPLRQLAHSMRLVSREFDGVGLLGFVCKTGTPPSAAAREAMTELLEGGSNLRAVATVIEGEGFQSALVRSVVLAFSYFRPYETLTTGDPASACQWMSEQLNNVDSNELSRQLAALRPQPP